MRAKVNHGLHGFLLSRKIEDLLDSACPKESTTARFPLSLPSLFSVTQSEIDPWLMLLQNGKHNHSGNRISQKGKK